MDKLDSSPFPGDLREELAVQPAKGTSKVTLALAAGVVLVAGILIGIQAETWFGGAAGAPPQAAAQQRPMGGGYGQQRGQIPGAGQQQPGGGQRIGGTVGTVEKVEGGKVYVKTMDGTTVTVTTTDQTTVQISKPGKVSDLEAGTTIVVRGRQGADGAVAATSISQGSQGFQGGGPR
ncbi:hypothetical protein [Nonomuraea rubra]|uniref:DUF5666 domain-containing protein n=1 Tax=Nonomuraea rubra TaxID=46180 RepID=A0A7X0NZI8_9ACTN|nr:hypothetical protein [Nonomuraea rubra]MBB6552518.1 hypothetical protein [Nonomuraea rubra]